MIYIEFDRGRPGNEIGSGVLFKVLYGAKNNCYQNFICYYCQGDSGNGLGVFSIAAIVYDKSITVRQTATYASTAVYTRVRVYMYGNFNFDEIQIDNMSFDRRVEVRNENDVLITDNGLPWADGTYPPDAKNRTGRPLGMVNPNLTDELKSGLTGDLTNIERDGE